MLASALKLFGTPFMKAFTSQTRCDLCASHSPDHVLHSWSEEVMQNVRFASWSPAQLAGATR